MHDPKHPENHTSDKQKNANRDPLTGAPGAHPVGTGVGAAAGGAAGAAGGAAAGAAMGTGAAGPIGGVAGAVIGAVAGGAAGKGVAEHYNPTEEDAYWREHHNRQPYYDKNYSFEDYQAAYRTGYEGYGRFCNTGRTFDQCEPELRQDYERRGNSRVTWENARPAVRAAWERLHGGGGGDRQLDRYLDYDVVDRNEEVIGTMNSIWSDHHGEPAYIGVKTGWIFGKTHVVPAHQAQVNQSRRRIKLPFDQQKIKDAPSYDAESEMTYEKEQEVNRYYGITGTHEHSYEETHTGTTTEPTHQHATPEMATIQLSEEELKIGKRQVEAGGVRLRKIVRTEIVNQPVEVQREELIIERVPAEEAHTGRQQAFNEQEVYIPLRREEVVVQKETVLKEEVRARKRKQTDRQEVSEEVRKEDIEIQESGEARPSGNRTRRPGSAKDIREQEAQPRSRRRHEP